MEGILYRLRICRSFGHRAATRNLRKKSEVGLQELQASPNYSRIGRPAVGAGFSRRGRTTARLLGGWSPADDLRLSAHASAEADAYSIRSRSGCDAGERRYELLGRGRDGPFSFDQQLLRFDVLVI